MQPKSAIFISAALTAFVLVTLVGVVNAMHSLQTTTEPITQPVELASLPAQAATQAPTSLPPTLEPIEPTATAAAFGPLEAVAAASQFMNQQDVYSVESSTYNQTPAYKVVFSSGDIVYLGLDGQVLGTAKLQPVVVEITPTKAPKKQRADDNNQSSGSQTASHEDDDDHEDEGDHD